MNYNVYNSSVSSYYQNFIYTRQDWVVFDISDTQTVLLIGSYECSGNQITGTTNQVVTITTDTGYGSTPDIQVEQLDGRNDTVNFTSTVSYRMYSNIEGAPTQRNSTYETSFRTTLTIHAVLVALVFAFVFNYIKGLIVWRK